MRSLAMGLLTALPLLAACSGGSAAPHGAGASASTSTSSGTAGASSSSASAGAGGADGGSEFSHPWLSNDAILVDGEATSTPFGPCTTDLCRHCENTDLINWKGAIWLVHRTAVSQVLGPNSSLRVSRSTDGGKTFALQAILPSVDMRDIRDPHFYVVGSKLYIKTLCRLEVDSTRDSNVDTLPQWTSSADGKTWSPITPFTDGMGNTWHTHSFWRIKEQGGVYYSAAYLDGDLSVTLFSSTDGVTWTKGADVYTVSADTPLETELTFMPSGKLLALVRTDGTDSELLGDNVVKTHLCWADPPYSSFSCPGVFNGQRLDGPLSFFHGGRLFVVARKHLGASDKKRTSLFEITGTFEGGPLSIKEWGELPSGGDTSYAGVATIDADHALVSWYSGDVQKDEIWALGMLDATNIWTGVIDFTKLK